MAKLTRIATGPESQGPNPWEYTHTETWKADQPVTQDDLKQLEKDEYDMFPVLRVRFEIGDDLVTVTATVVTDNCR